MNLPDSFSYNFFPVGQGLFTSGLLNKSGEAVPLFLWVYDCGTSSSQQLVSTGINQLGIWTQSRRRIDLLTLSHFDNDHISGVCKLIEGFRIRTLMLPYMPLAQRLIIAFEEGLVQHDELMGFFVNPVAYLLARIGPGIGRILFVLPSGTEGPPPPGDQLGDTPEGPNPNRDDPDIDFERAKPSPPEEIVPLFQAAQDQGTQTTVEFLEKGSSITFRSFWEFVPYNDDPEIEIPIAFLDQVRIDRARLLSQSGRSRKNALRKLRKTYDEQFGADSEGRNMISLFLYSGPIYPSWNVTELLHYYPLNRFWRLPVHMVRSVCSLIYSGDGYLDTLTRLKRFVDFIGRARVDCTAVFQVMHHGAEANWHRGVAEAMAPLISIFCSDPERKQWGHPHAPVLRDFWPYCPVQVDKTAEAYIVGHLA